MTHSTHPQHLPFTDGHYKSILSFFLSSIKREGLFDFIFPAIKWGKTHRQHFPKMLKCHCKNALAILFSKVRRPLIYPTPLSSTLLPPLSACFWLSLPSLLSLYPERKASLLSLFLYLLFFLSTHSPDSARQSTAASSTTSSFLTYPPSLLFYSPLLSSPFLSSHSYSPILYSTASYPLVSFPSSLLPFSPLSYLPPPSLCTLKCRES